MGVFISDKFWGSNMSLVSMGANFLCHLVNIILGHKYSTKPRILISLMFNIVLFAVSTVFTRIDTDPWQLEFYGLTLAFALLFNINDSIFQGVSRHNKGRHQFNRMYSGAYTSIMARFPPSFMGSMMQGQSFGGIMSSGLSVILLIVGGGDTVEVATWYFLFATVFLLGTLLIFITINRNSFYKLYLNKEKETNVRVENDHSSFSHLVVVKDIWMLNVSIFLVYVVSLSVYPSLVRLVQPVGSSKTWQKYFIPVGVFFAYNFLDFVGRMMAVFIQWPRPTKIGSAICLATSVTRFALVPVLLLCNLSPDDRHVTPVLIRSDAVFLTVHVIVSLSNGYLTTITMMNAPQMVEGDTNQSVVGSVMVFMLVCGLLAGSCVSYLWILLL